MFGVKDVLRHRVRSTVHGLVERFGHFTKYDRVVPHTEKTIPLQEREIGTEWTGVPSALAFGIELRRTHTAPDRDPSGTVAHVATRLKREIDIAESRRPQPAGAVETGRAVFAKGTDNRR